MYWAHAHFIQYYKIKDVNDLQFVSEIEMREDLQDKI